MQSGLTESNPKEPSNVRTLVLDSVKTANETYDADRNSVAPTKLGRTFLTELPDEQNEKPVILAHQAMGMIRQRLHKK